jgi:hypothetical protein
MNELVQFLRDKTHMARLAAREVEEVIEHMLGEGYTITPPGPKAAVPVVAPVAPAPVAPVPAAPVPGAAPAPGAAPTK